MDLGKRICHGILLSGLHRKNKILELPLMYLVLIIVFSSQFTATLSRRTLTLVGKRPELEPSTLYLLNGAGYSGSGLPRHWYCLLLYSLKWDSPVRKLFLGNVILLEPGTGLCAGIKRITLVIYVLVIFIPQKWNATEMHPCKWFMGDLVNFLPMELRVSVAKWFNRIVWNKWNTMAMMNHDRYRACGGGI